MTLVLVAEGHRRIGLGHVFTMLAVAEAGRRMGLPTQMLGIGDLAASTLRRRGISAAEYAPDARALRALGGNGPDIAIVDVRTPEAFDFTPLSAAGFVTCAVEEFGEGRPGADVVVNPTPVRRWHRLPDGYRAVLAGTQYLIMGPEFEDAHTRPRAELGTARRIVVSMGGVDRSGATLVIARALALLAREQPQCIGSVHFVCGPAFTYAASLERLLEDAGYSHEVLVDVPDMWEHLLSADVLISAGGNTMFEAACCGAPSLVFWEDPHEYERGEAAETAGFARLHGRGADTPPEVAAELIGQCLADTAWLRLASEQGRLAVDGRGAARVLEALTQLVDAHAS